MNKSISTTAALAALFTASTQALATGFVTLPATGLAAPGGTSAYAACNTTGEFGSNPNGSTPPTPSANNNCAIFRTTTDTPPLSGYVLRARTTRNITMNNVYTNNTNVVVGTVIDEVWRNSSTQCIYGTKVRLNNVDYDRRAVSPGPQFFEINDILRAGFRNRGPVSVAYHFTTTPPAASDDVIYRAGLTFTSVVNEPGDPAQPLTSVAPISTNWVDFTTDVNFFDPDGSSVRDSSYMFVRSGCTTATPTTVAGALRFRQMGQEDQPLIEVSVTGFAPAGANTAP